MIIRLNVKKVCSIAILMIVLLGGFLRFYNLGVKEFSSTELNTVLAIGLNFQDMFLDRLKLGTIPVYYILLKFWAGLFGESQVSLRLLSALFGTLSIYILFLIGREVFNSKIALIAAFLFSLSRNHLFFSQWARANAPCLFFLLISVFFFIKAMKNNNDGSWRKYTIFRVIALYLYGFPIFISLAELVYVSAFCRKREKIKKFLFSMALAVIALLPFWISIVFLIPQTAQSSGSIYIPNLPNSEAMNQFFLAWGNSHIIVNDWGGKVFLYPVLFLFGSIVSIFKYISALRNTKMNNTPSNASLYGLVFLCAVIPPGILYAFAYIFSRWLKVGFSFFNNAYLLPAECAYLLFVGAACYWVPDLLRIFRIKVKPVLKLCISIVVVIGLLSGKYGAFSNFYTRKNPEWRKAIEYVKDRSLENEKVISFPWQNERFIDHYYGDVLKSAQTAGYGPISLTNEQRIWLIVEAQEVQDKTHFIEKLKVTFNVLEENCFYGVASYYIESKKELKSIYIDGLITEKADI